MLQGIRPSTLAVPSFGQSLSLTGVQKMEGFSDVDPWSWTPQQPNSLPPGYAPIFDTSLYSHPQNTLNSPQNIQPRHQSLAHPHPVNPAPLALLQKGTPPPRQQSQVAGNAVKAQPAFKPTWHGFLETTKDAMTIVEAALQGRLSHISRRPHDKERAEMLTSGTVLVYEENASGIKRWTDAVHWSPSRVMHNCLIYRQLVRALKPEEKKASLNSSCGNKRKRKESASPAVTNSGDNVPVAEDEYEHSAMEVPPEETSSVEPYERVYENFAQKLTLEQQRRYCGSLIDSYEFKEGGLMKKTISVKYQGTTHHIISYYTLEDVVSGRLKRPFQDPRLADIQPRQELLTGWKVSLEDEESKETPQFGGYQQSTQPGQALQPGENTHNEQTQGRGSGPVHLQVATNFWPGQVPHFSPAQHGGSNYGPQSNLASPYTTHVPQEYPPQQTPISPYNSQEPPTPQYHQPAPPNCTPIAAHSTHQYPAQRTQGADSSSNYQTAAQPAQQYSSVMPASHYIDPPSAPPYADSEHAPMTQQAQYAVPQPQNFDMPVPVSQIHTPSPHPTQSPIQQDPHRRASSVIAVQPYGQIQAQPRYQPDLQSETFYIPDQKFIPDQKPPTGAYGY
jgi:hypothetical protein